MVEGFIEGDEVAFLERGEGGVDDRAETGFMAGEHGADIGDEAVAAGVDEVGVGAVGVGLLLLVLLFAFHGEEVDVAEDGDKRG